jgi:hypothetical protein
MSLMRAGQLLSNIVSIKECGDRLQRQVLSLNDSEVEVSQLEREPSTVDDLERDLNLMDLTGQRRILFLRSTSIRWRQAQQDSRIG